MELVQRTSRSALVAARPPSAPVAGAYCSVTRALTEFMYVLGCSFQIAPVTAQFVIDSPRSLRHQSRSSSGSAASTRGASIAPGSSSAATRSRSPSASARRRWARPLREIRDQVLLQARKSAHRLPPIRELPGLIGRRMRRVLRQAPGESPQPSTSRRRLPRQLIHLAWDSSLTSRHRVTHGDLLVRESGLDAWAAGSLLPPSGKCSFVLRVEQRDGRAGRACIGVCDADSRVGWGLHMQSGRLLRWTRDSDGKVRSGAQSGPQPASFGWATHQMYGVSEPAGGSKGVVDVEVGVDHDAGTLVFSINGESPVIALRGLPRAPMRPWARLMSVDDRAQLSQGTGVGLIWAPERYEATANPWANRNPTPTVAGLARTASSCAGRILV